uniref:Cell division protein n=1 Tax=Jenufa perforata TaxID=993091 RepID=A0A0S2LNE8_9CHLO|nr:cell division protein [Jenufa perforata]ALO62855.1 cell division protein [Jenufa perforata]
MQQQTQTLRKRKRLKKKSQYLQFLFCSFLNWRYSIDSKWNLKTFFLKKQVFSFQLSHFFSLLFLIFGYKKFENKHQTNNLNSEQFSLNSQTNAQATSLNSRDKAKEIFLFWQYFKTNIDRKLETYNQKTIFSYWFLPMLGFISFQYIKSSFIKTKNSSNVSSLTNFRKIPSLKIQGVPSKPLNFDTEIDKLESFLAFSNFKKHEELLNSKEKFFSFPKKKKKGLQTNRLNLTSLLLNNKSSFTKFSNNEHQEKKNLEFERKQLRILTKKFFKELGICSSFFSLNKINNNLSQSTFNKFSENNDVLIQPKSLSYLNKNFFQTSSFFWNWYILDSSRNYYKNLSFFSSSSFFSKEKKQKRPLTTLWLNQKNSLFPETLAPLGFLKETKSSIIDTSKFYENKFDKNVYLEKKEIDNFFDLFSVFFNLKEKKKLNINKKELKTLIKKNPFYSYEKACFLWEMYLKNYSFESQQKLDYLKKINEDLRNVDKLISDNSVFNELDSLNSLNIFNKTRKFSKNLKNLDPNAQNCQIHELSPFFFTYKKNGEKQFFSRLKSNKQKSNHLFSSSLFLKNIIHLQNSNFRSYFFIKNKHKKYRKKKIENVSIRLASLNLKNHLINTLCFEILKHKNNRLNNSHSISQFQSFFLLKDLKTLKDKMTLFLFFEEKNAKKAFLSNMLFLKQLFLIKKPVKIFNSIGPQKNLLENKNLEQNLTSINKTKIIKYRFPILMSGYPEKFNDLFLSNRNKTQMDWTFFLKKPEKSENLYNLNKDIRKPKLSLLKKQELIKKINAKNTPFSSNFQIEIQKVQKLKRNSHRIKSIEKKMKTNYGNIKNNKLKTKNNFKKKFLFFDHTFFFSKKKKNKSIVFDSFKSKQPLSPFSSSFLKGFLYNWDKQKYSGKFLKTKKNFIVSYQSLKFVKSNFLISNFYLAQNLKLNSVFLKHQKQISFLNLLSEVKSTKMFSSFIRFLLNFLDKSYYLINNNQGYQRTFAFCFFSKEKNSTREKNFYINQNSQFEYEKNGKKKIKDSFGIVSKLRQFSNLIKTFFVNIFYTNVSEKIFVIFKRIKILVYRKILKNFIFISLNKENKKQTFFSLRSSKRPTEESKKEKQFKLKRKTKLIDENSSLFIVPLNKGLPKNLKKNFLLSSLEKRKYEKIFRTYLSSKSEYKVKKNESFLNQTNDFSKKKIVNSIKNRILHSSFKIEKRDKVNKKILLKLNNKVFFLKEEKIRNSLNFKQFKNKIFLKSKLKRLTVRLSPNEFLKKKHLLFFTDSYKNLLSSEEKSRLEKTKDFQKKRRLKKQKKETRRRKRRKRFYPRPFWLRFKTYQKFLQIRHFKLNIPFETKQQKSLQDSAVLTTYIQKKLKNFEKLKSKNLQPIKVDIYLFKKANRLKYYKKKTYLSSLNKNFFYEMKITQDILRKKIYRRNKQKWGHCVYETPKSEKIFLKKSKFLWSLPLLDSRNFYQLSNNLKNDFQRMSWKSYWLRHNLSRYCRRVNVTLENLQESFIQECFSKTLKSFLLNLLGFDISFVDRESDKYSYLNGNFRNQNFLTLNKLPLPISKIQFKNSIESKFLFINSSEYSQAVLFSEYQRILYNRMLESFKHIKQNLSGDGYLKTKFFHIGRKKFSFTERRKNFWQKFNNFVNLEVPTSAIQPSGYSTKLRGLWALNKTNLLTFKERNMIQSLWSSEKLREQNKSKRKSIFKKTFQDLKKILLNLNSQDLENFYFVKTQNKEQKLDVLGSFLLKEKKQPNAFQLKMELKKRNTFFLFLDEKKQKEQIQQEKFFYEPRFYRKRVSNYWWNTKIQKNFLTFSDCFIFSDFPYTESPIFLVSLWIGTFLIHLSLLCFLFLIPEIRSVVKFQILLFSKICLGLTLTLYYLSDEFKNRTLRVKVFIFKYLGFLKSNIWDKIFIHDSSFGNKIRKPFKSVSQLSLEKLNSIFIEKTFSTSNFSYIYSISKKNQRKNLSLMNIKSSLLFVKYNLKILINNKILKQKSSFLFFTSKKPKELFFSVFSFLFKKKKTKRKNKKFYLEYLKYLYSKVFYLLYIESGLVLVELEPLTLLITGSLIFIKKMIQVFRKCFFYFSLILVIIIDFIESIFIIIYKCLEKPAELLIEWMAQIFLIEWSSNRLLYVPETFDIQIWNSMYKTSRSLRIFSIPTSLLIRRVWSLQELFFKYIYKPDRDLIYRQKKGILFWDLWVDILLQIADKNNLNIPSLNTLKEEQQLFIKTLLQDENWEKYSTNMEKTNPLYSSQNLFSNFFFLKGKNKGKDLKIQKQFKGNNQFPLFLINKKKKAQKEIHKFNNFSLFKNSNIFVKSLRFLEENKEMNQHRNISLKNDSRWSFHQDWIYKGRETDLFLDIHPPKSLADISYLKSTQLTHQSIATFVCQIFSGIFSKQVAKNVLLIGPQGLGKRLFVEAMAGETEFRMITEHAHRYSIISKGVAVGMKLLRHVFESLSFSTPCFFLIEDIHLIGEKRPITLFDDENVTAFETPEEDEDESYEKEKVIFQFNHHSYYHFRKPSRGESSLLIPTNYYCFDLFLGVSAPKTRYKGPFHPLNMEFIQNQLNNQTEKQKSFANSDKFKIDNVSNKLVTHLQLPSRKFLSPPPTSPFTLLALKEQQKLQPQKVVKQIPWGGLSWDQMMRMPKTTYFVKTKVAMLAEIGRTQFMGKLEKITDLLILVDNVRSNRGFVVFGTTHIPYVLDPALRRPGRFDETISLPYIPNLLTRWQILKTSVSQFSKTLDCLDYAAICKNLHENQISDFLVRAKFSLSNNDKNFKSLRLTKEWLKNFDVSMNLSNLLETNRPIKPHVSFSSTQLCMRKFLTNSMNRETNNFFNIRNQQTLVLRNELNLNNNSFSDLNTSFKILLQNSPRNFLPFSIGSNKKEKIRNFSLDKKVAQSKYLSTILKRLAFYSFIPSGPSNVLSMTYFHVSKLLIYANILKDPTSFGLLLFSSNSLEFSHNTIAKILSCSSNDLSLEFLRLFAGKIGEFFVFSSTHKQKYKTSVMKKKNSQSLLSSADFFANGVYSFYGIDENWRSITNLAFSILQKRYFYSKNLIVSKLLRFDNCSSLEEVRSSPASFCNIPGKYYENFRKVEKDFNQKFSFSLSEKIDLIKKRNLTKKLYNKSIQELFLFPRQVQNFSFSRNNNETYEIGFNKSFYKSFNICNRELIPISSSTTRITSSNSYYRKRILERHRFSFVNNWWNGHLEEATSEAAFLSDVDWRYRFTESLGDIMIDFPDPEQYYNPRSRRWMLSSGSWADWNSFEKTLNEEISYHYINESFNKAFTFLENYREILDHLAYKLLKNGFLKEIDVLNIFNRFCILKK